MTTHDQELNASVIELDDNSVHDYHYSGIQDLSNKFDNFSASSRREEVNLPPHGFITLEDSAHSRDDTSGTTTVNAYLCRELDGKIVMLGEYKPVTSCPNCEQSKFLGFCVCGLICPCGDRGCKSNCWETIDFDLLQVTDICHKKGSNKLSDRRISLLDHKKLEEQRQQKTVLLQKKEDDGSATHNIQEIVTEYPHLYNLTDSASYDGQDEEDAEQHRIDKDCFIQEMEVNTRRIDEASDAKDSSQGDSGCTFGSESQLTIANSVFNNSQKPHDSLGRSSCTVQCAQSHRDHASSATGSAMRELTSKAPFANFDVTVQVSSAPAGAEKTIGVSPTSDPSLGQHTRYELEQFGGESALGNSISTNMLINKYNSLVNDEVVYVSDVIEPTSKRSYSIVLEDLDQAQALIGSAVDFKPEASFVSACDASVMDDTASGPKTTLRLAAAPSQGQASTSDYANGNALESSLSFTYLGSCIQDDAEISAAAPRRDQPINTWSSKAGSPKRDLHETADCFTQKDPYCGNQQRKSAEQNAPSHAAEGSCVHYHSNSVAVCDFDESDLRMMADVSSTCRRPEVSQPDRVALGSSSPNASCVPVQSRAPSAERAKMPPISKSRSFARQLHSDACDVFQPQQTCQTQMPHNLFQNIGTAKDGGDQQISAQKAFELSNHYMRKSLSATEAELLKQSYASIDPVGDQFIFKVAKKKQSTTPQSHGSVVLVQQPNLDYDCEHVSVNKACDDLFHAQQPKPVQQQFETSVLCKPAEQTAQYSSFQAPAQEIEPVAVVETLPAKEYAHQFVMSMSQDSGSIQY